VGGGLGDKGASAIAIRLRSAPLPPLPHCTRRGPLTTGCGDWGAGEERGISRRHIPPVGGTGRWRCPSSR